MKTLIKKTSIIILICIAFIFATSCDILTGSKDKEPEENQTTQQTPDDNQPVTPTVPDDDTQNPEDDPENQQNNQSQDETTQDQDPETPDPETTDPVNPEPVELQIIFGQPLSEDYGNLENYSGVKISFAENTQTIDVFALLDLYEQLKDDAPENFPIQIDEYPENSTFLIDFAAKEAAGKSNTDLLNEYYTSYVNDKLTSSNVGEVVRTELIPGVEIVTFMDRWDDIDNKPWFFFNAFNVSLETKVQMPKNYSLSGTYKSGIIGDNVTLENLDSNTNISGMVSGKESFSSVYDLFVKNKDASELPNMNVEFEGMIADYQSANEINLYGHSIDTLIKDYFDGNKGNKLNLSLSAGDTFIFDARDYLNGDSMYEGNTYKNNAYPLDINAALVMNPGIIRNVQIVKEKEVQRTSEKNELGSLQNVVVSVSLSGITIAAKGVVDFMDEAPTEVYGEYSFITFKKVSNTVNVGGMGYIDATALSQAQANHIVGPNNYYSIKKLAVTPGVTLPGADIRQGEFDSINGFGITKQQVEQNTNDELINPLKVSKVLPRNIKQNKMDLMRNILEDNQPILLSFSDLPTHCHSRA